MVLHGRGGGGGSTSCIDVHISYEARPSHSLSLPLSQEEDLQEIIGKIASKQAECEEAHAQAAQLRSSFEEAEQQYKKHKDQMSAIADEADSMKVTRLHMLIA